MHDERRPPVWQMVRDAVDALGGDTTNIAVRDWILRKYPGTNKSTISCQIIICSVNHDSRVHFPENHKPRTCSGRHDFLYRPQRGRIVWYDPARHGIWEIAERDDGSLCVQTANDAQDGGSDASVPPIGTEGHPAGEGATFAAESHLRDYLVQHLEDIEPGMDLFVDEQGIDGVEYSTPIGRIDILATDREGRFVVIELKVGQGPDAVCGQLMRYMGWTKRHLDEDSAVRGIIVAQRVSDRIRYALADVPNVTLKEYELSLKLRDAEPLE